MTSVFDVTGGTSHSSAVSGLVNGGAYAYYVRCSDTDGNANLSDFAIRFSVDQLVTNPPTITGGEPSGELPAGTTQTVLSVITDGPATCRDSLTPGVDYDSMTGSFPTVSTLGTMPFYPPPGEASRISHKSLPQKWDSTRRSSPTSRPPSPLDAGRSGGTDTS